ncbi:unnamed protein product [Owenia fusiformis]|uniref:Uncharacterized protein n=1 Tax=Owenia fusiformis TaxID=6347 RepID=A0A8J1XJ11_OWEFU|nr:unnamed protein product [Owenia fusiformis]
MMEVDQQLRALLQGELIEDSPLFVDFPIENAESFKPITKRTVCYIVVGLVFDEKGRVLLMQEAKQSCYGKWYLPAGRMELNETIEEAVYREVLEETGLKISTTTLLCVEAGSSSWFRFTLAGKVTGGSLKETPDQESLSAKWCTLEEINFGTAAGLTLRANDIKPLIDLGLEFFKADRQDRHTDILPICVPHKFLFIRLVILYCDKSRGDILVITRQGDNSHFPIGHISHKDKSMLGILGHTKYLKQVTVLTIEHRGKPIAENDGFCMTLLVTMETENKDSHGKTKEEIPTGTIPEILNDDYIWHKIVDDKIRKRFDNKLKLERPISIPMIFL